MSLVVTRGADGDRGANFLGDIFRVTLAVVGVAVFGVAFATGIGELATGALLFGFADIAAGGAVGATSICGGYVVADYS